MTGKVGARWRKITNPACEAVGWLLIIAMFPIMVAGFASSRASESGAHV